ncbi:uncharacterized protein LOC124174057 isoform X2 [Ischnura elegans]|uniref:uncharacterized protein LOC124174057 isoform X2 n=1 Tax=Ischnura elegans TaxID=197161 RepID=UPI001ED8A766|nr:uncharacterized protein LOC124174057 isoform X2 [Ischnura elegans]
MQSASTLVILLFLALSRVARAAEDDTDVAAPTDRLSISAEQLPSVDMSALSSIAVSAGAAALGVAGLALVAYLILYMFGVKRCHLLGTCDALAAATAHFTNPPPPHVTAGHYSSQMDTSPYGAYAPQQPQTNPPATYQHEGNSFNKRSLEYVGPVLRSLASAYDKYEKWGS